MCLEVLKQRGVLLLLTKTHNVKSYINPVMSLFCLLLVLAVADVPESTGTKSPDQNLQCKILTVITHNPM